LIDRGVSHDNGVIRSVLVNGKQARVLSSEAGVVDWEIDLDGAPVEITAFAADEAGNIEKTAHVMRR